MTYVEIGSALYLLQQVKVWLAEGVELVVVVVVNACGSVGGWSSSAAAATTQASLEARVFFV